MPQFGAQPFSATPNFYSLNILAAHNNADKPNDLCMINAIPKKHMSGTRSHSFREGDRSEYFARVLLSGLGLCTPIPRQEDIGFDFVCNLSDQESGILTFGHSYIVSVKSASSPEIDLEATKAGIEANSQRHIEWIFREELPAFLAVVDKDSFTMRFYSLIPIWFIYYEGGPKCGRLTLHPRLDATNLGDVGRPSDEGELPNWKGKHHFKVDLLRLA